MKFDVNIRAVFQNEKATKAIASVTMEDSFVVHDVRLLASGDKLFIAMPYKVFTDAQGNEVRKDVFHPIHSDARKELEAAVIDAYQAKIQTSAE